ncbi:hypothetical protein [Desulfitobacterium sp. AusDCA]|uniref:hypothetical protein n=1 Tax=Desulfitobacterium sp. AusDCA TaxID=3240383 RepID=UPI003DA75594
MIKALIDSYVNISKENKPEEFSFFNFDGKSYYLCNKISRSLSLSQNLYNDYYLLAIEAFIKEDILFIEEKHVVLFGLDSDEKIVNVINPDDFCIKKEYRIDLAYDALIPLKQMIDFESFKGCNILLDNLLNSNTLPEKLLSPTDLLDFTFTREINTTEASVPLKNVIGTGHPDYKGKSWLEIFFSLKRPINILNAIFSRNYYLNLRKMNDHSDGLSFINIDNFYYVNSGNHRTTIAKIMGISQVFATVTYYTTDKIYEGTYLKLKRWHFNLDFLEGNDLCFFKNKFSKKYNWEILKVGLGTKSILLYTHQMLRDFCYAFEILPVNGLRKFSFCLNKQVPTEKQIKSFFLKNYKLLIEHKNQLIQEGKYSEFIS